jgi:hypothetical protein
MPFLQHPVFNRRVALQAGSIGLLGLGMNHLAPLRAMAAPQIPRGKARSVIYIFLSGGLSQLDSFDLKPDAPAEIRGEFRPAATRTPGLRVCEHLPRLAQRSHLWALCRSLTHPYTGHSQGHLAMLTGRTPMPPETPENLAATIYDALGLPPTAAYRDPADRPHYIYHGKPIAGLT